MVDIGSPLVSAYCFRLEEDGPQYLALHRREGIDRLGGTWQAVHGGIEEGETAAQAAWREVQEETGAKPMRFWELDYVETFYAPHLDALRLVPCFAAQLAQNVPVAPGAEHDAHEWLRRPAILERFLWRSQREAVQVLHREIALPLHEGRPVNPLLALSPPEP